MVELSSRGKIFYADASKGYTIKILVDILSGALSRATFCLGKSGISIREADPNQNLLFDAVFPRENFREYRCRQSMYVSLNLKHLQKMIRNVKKKDSVVIFIDKDRKTHLGLSIRPESASQKSNRSETVFISVQEEKTPEHLDLPEVCRTNKGNKKVYSYPVVIPATDFQKIKKMMSVGREIVVKMQKSNYLSFFSDSGLFSTDLEFGAIVNESGSDSEDSDEYCSDSDDSICDTEEPISDEERPEEDNTQESDADVEEYDVEESDGVKKPPGWYEASFYTNIISLMVKLPGLCSQMQIYAPRFGYPLKIKMNAGTGNSILGTLQVYIKDIDMINSEKNFSRDRNGEE